MHQISTRKSTWRAVLVFLYRWFSGRELDGRRRTNASWRHIGTKPLTVTGYASRWAHLPGYKRSMIRNAVAVPTLLVSYGLITDYDRTIATGRIILLLVLPLIVIHVVEQVRSWDHHRKTTVPIGRSSARQSGWSPHANPHSWITVPRGFRDDPEKAVTVRLGPEYYAGQGSQRALGLHIAAKLGLVDPDVEWDHAGNSTIMIRARPAPPSLVTMAMVAELLSKVVSGKPLLGMGPRGKAVYVDLDNESPHVLISMGTGGGKTVLMQFMVIQELHLGSLALILDIKRVSHSWARNLNENVAYARDIGAIHHALLWLAGEVQRRYDVIDQHSDEYGNVPAELVGPRLVVVLEEVNATMNALTAHWRQIKDPSDTGKSPAVQAFHDVLFMGRQGRVNVVAAGQYVTAASLGGGEARENFATRILGRGSRNVWNILAKDIDKKSIPKASNINGRVQVVAAGEVTPCQVVKVEVPEARKYVNDGTVASWSEVPSGHPLLGWGGAPGLANEPRVSPGRAQLQLVHSVDDSASEDFDTDELIGLKDAADQGILSCGLGAARVQSRDDPEFPKPRKTIGTHSTAKKLYSVSELRCWDRNRVHVSSGS